MSWLVLAVFALVAAQAAGPSGKVFESKSGPWGKFEYQFLYLEAPNSLLAHVSIPNSIPSWRFQGASEASLRKLFTQALLSPALQTRLLDPQRMSAQPGVITLFPTVADIEALGPKERSVVYAELAKSALNEFHESPVYFSSGDVDAWLQNTHLRQELQDEIRKLSYPRGSALAFSDIAVLVGMARSDAEVRHVLKSATRTRTLVARLKIEPGADLEQLANYWTAGHRIDDVMPLLSSAVETGVSTELDVAHLLPPLARQLLYTYPTAEQGAQGRLPDCHWTSLNFFNYEPQQYYRDTRLATNRVLERYTQVSAPYTFGDVLFMLDGAGNAIHSCVYIADDVVFSKNGENQLCPWALKKLDGVQDIYQRDGGRTQGYREKRDPVVAGGVSSR